MQLAESVGSDTELHLDHQGQSLVVLVQEVIRYELGQIVSLYVDPKSFYVFDPDSTELCGKTSQNHK